MKKPQNNEGKSGGVFPSPRSRGPSGNTRMQLAHGSVEMGHTRLMWVSAKERDGVDNRMTRMASYVGKMKEDQADEQQKIKATGATTVE